MSTALSAALLAFAVGLAATWLVRALARRLGMVAAPSADRWHRRPTALLGGLAIATATAVPFLALADKSPRHWTVAATVLAMLVLGLLDDVFSLAPHQKLVGQLGVAAVVVHAGLLLPWTGSVMADTALTVFWLVGITNAVNMLDNMDGLAGGVAAIAALGLTIDAALRGHAVEVVLLAGLLGALLAFLVFNHQPASIFMGDCGSLFVGFLLACAVLLGQQGGTRSRSLVAVFAMPVLVLCVPIFDTSFVTLMRKLSGRAASQGGRDHTSHRLVVLGLSERQAVWTLWSMAGMGGTLALLTELLPADVAVVSIGCFAILLALLGTHLGRVRVYGEERPRTAPPAAGDWSPDEGPVDA